MQICRAQFQLLLTSSVLCCAVLDSNVLSCSILCKHAVPSATYRRLNQLFIPGPNYTGDVQGLNRDELGNWNIDSVTFTCGEINTTEGPRGRGATRVYEQTQPNSPDDVFGRFLANISKALGTTADLNNQLVQTCALTIVVSRLSSTLVVQSVVPVAFVGALSFVIFFVSPDAVDFRVGERSLFPPGTEQYSTIQYSTGAVDF